MAQVRRLVTIHRDPDHTDADLEGITAEALEQARTDCAVTIGAEGAKFAIGIV